VFLLSALLAPQGEAAIMCDISSIVTGPPLTITFAIRETTYLGIKRISVTESFNAAVHVPTFPQGATAPQVVTAAQLVPEGGIRVALEIENMAGAKKTCGYSEQVPDTQAPICEVRLADAAPELRVEFSVRDNESGVKEIQAVENLNASVLIPPFSVGARGPLTVTATEVTPSDRLQVEIRVTDVAGNSTSCSYAEPPPIDNIPPRSELVSQTAGPPVVLKVEFLDLESGLQTVNVVEATNAKVAIQSFEPGTTGPVTATITQIIGDLDFQVRIAATDRQGNSETFPFSTRMFEDVRPEFDSVGTDSANFFGDLLKSRITQYGKDASGRKINDFSNFPSEYFIHTSGGVIPDPCFSSPAQSYMSAFNPTYTEGTYEWQIALQMKPSADILVQVIGCVLRSGEMSVWKDARQTGLYRVPWDATQSRFAPGTSPRLTVKALPGPNARKGFPADGFFLDARSAPGLDGKPLLNAVVPLQAFMRHGILTAVPRTGLSNSLGQTMYELSSGDRLRVTLTIPFNSTADLYLGSDNLVLTYIGVMGTELLSSD
jgi:hypothetical protein